MSDGFDPYQKWLGIPPSDQPPNHYRLLGVPPLSSDLDMLSNAADQRMIYLRTFRTSQQQSLAERLLCEVAAARACLLDSTKKAAYDVELMRGTAPATPAASPRQDAKLIKRPPPRPGAAQGAAAEIAPPAPDGIAALITPQPQHSPRRALAGKKPAGLSPVAIAVMALLALTTLGLGLYFLLHSSQPPQVAASTDPHNVAPLPAAGGDDNHSPAPQQNAAPSPAVQPPIGPLSASDVRAASTEREKPAVVIAAPAAPAAAPQHADAPPSDRAATLQHDLQRRLAADDLVGALALVRELAVLEKADVLLRQTDTLRSYAGSASSPAALRAVIGGATTLVQAATTAQRADLAQASAVQALVAARQLDHPDAIRDATFLVLAARKTKSP